MLSKPRTWEPFITAGREYGYWNREVELKGEESRSQASGRPVGWHQESTVITKASMSRAPCYSADFNFTSSLSSGTDSSVPACPLASLGIFFPLLFSFSCPLLLPRSTSRWGQVLWEIWQTRAQLGGEGSLGPLQSFPAATSSFSTATGSPEALA